MTTTIRVDKQIKTTNAPSNEEVLAFITASGLPSWQKVDDLLNPLDVLEFNTAYVHTGAEPVGSMHWNPDRETLDIHMPGDTTLQMGQEVWYFVKNQTGAQIDNGTLVSFAGTLGASGILKGQPAPPMDGSYPPRYIMGVATQDIANGGQGKITHFGEVRGIDTTGTLASEIWNDGDILYASPTISGYFTNSPPVAPNPVVTIAAVVKAGVSGTMFVRPTFSDFMSSLSDVYISSPQDGELLVWDAGDSRWENKPQSKKPIILISGNYVMSSNDYVILVSGTDTTYLTLPTGVPNGSSHYIKNLTSNFVVVSGIIDREINKTLSEQFSSITVVNYNNEWFII